MVKSNKLAADVDLEDLAKRTRNFSGAEIEGLVRSAQSTAMNKLVQVGGALYKVITLKSLFVEFDPGSYVVNYGFTHWLTNMPALLHGKC